MNYKVVFYEWTTKRIIWLIRENEVSNKYKGKLIVNPTFEITNMGNPLLVINKLYTWLILASVISVYQSI